MTELLYTLFPCLRPVPVPLDELEKRASACEEGAARHEKEGRDNLAEGYVHIAESSLGKAGELRRQARKYRLEIARRSGEKRKQSRLY